ncbi:MAG: pentapeptide repeat-containing protein [Magnetococcales bacterium]|nr:pentapeptide repeat-containing protein [Magnetococcales bacterium]
MNETLFTSFYSFKGGVGRSMLLVNVAAALAMDLLEPDPKRRAPKRVLIWDLDLEAPGLHLLGALRPEQAPAKGFLDWLAEWQEHCKQNARYAVPDEQQISRLLQECICPLGVTPSAEGGQETPTTWQSVEGLFLLPAMHGEGVDLVAYVLIDWYQLWEKEAKVAAHLFRNILVQAARELALDYILIDARTGLTDLGSLLTAALPHVAVLVANYSRQNTHGIYAMHQALSKAVSGQTPVRIEFGLPALELLLIASPVPDEKRHGALLKARRALWQERFSGMEQALEIPFVPEMLLLETLPVFCDQADPVRPYLRVAENLRAQLQKLRWDGEQKSKTDEAYPSPEGRRGREKEGTLQQGKRYEERVARLLRLLGYSVEEEQLVDGNRVDLVARMQRGFESVCYLVECKDYQKPLGKEVLETLRVCTLGQQAQAWGCQGMVVANAFSPAARTFAKAQGMVATTPQEMEARLFNFAPYLLGLRQAFESSTLARTYVQQTVWLEAHPQESKVDLLEYALRWASGQAGKKLWLLLGDYGTGKSAFFKRFAYQLAVQAEKDPSLPMPLAIDLKQFPNAISLETLIQEYLRTQQNWTGNPEIFLHLLEQGRLLLLLDAFDEMGTATIGRSVEEQFRQLARAATRGAGRVLITCRTHFFRDQQQIKQQFLGSDDSLESHDSPLGRAAREFDAALDELQLFDSDQIEQFLHRSLDGDPQRIAEARHFIQTTYNLDNLAPHPVMLEMILTSMDRLMARTRQEQAPITSALLYTLYTDEWLTDRSSNQLQTGVDQRRTLLEHLAWALWSQPQHRIHHRALLELLSGLQQQAFAGLDLSRVDLELRTATFLTRTGDGYYSFSHKSFREFFYARFVLRALRGESLAGALHNAPLTPETVAFLADQLAASDWPRLHSQLPALLVQGYLPQVSENALRLAYHLAAKADGWPVERRQESLTERMQSLLPPVVQLAGAGLAEERWAGAWLRGADLRGADLRGADLSGADLSGANLVEARLERALLQGVRAEQADFSRARLGQAILAQGRFAQARFVAAEMVGIDGVGADWREADLRQANLWAARLMESNLQGANLSQADCTACRFAQANLAGVQWQETRLERATAPGALQGPTDPELPPQLRRLPPASAIPHWQTTHGMLLLAAAFSPDERLLVTAGGDHAARVWEVASGRCLRILRGHGDWLRSAAFAPDGRTILTASDDGTARLWDSTSGQPLCTFQGHEGWVNCAAFAPDGRSILTASHDGAARLWDVDSGAPIRTFQGHEGGVNCAAFAPDGCTLVTAGEDGTARLWDVAPGASLRTFQREGKGLSSAAFAPDGRTFVTAGEDACIWEVASGTLLHRLTHDHPLDTACYSPDGRTLATSSAEQGITLWDTASGQRLRAFPGATRSAAFSPQGSWLVAASHSSRAVIWEVASGQMWQTFQGTTATLFSAAFSPDGAHIVAASLDGTAHLWDAHAGNLLGTLQGHEGWVNSAAFSPDGRQMVTASGDRTARIWESRSGQWLRTLQGHEGPVNSAAFSPDGRQMVTASEDQTARIWESRSGQWLRTLQGHEGPVNSAAFSPDGRQMVTASDDDTARIWESRSGQWLRTLQGHGGPLTSAAFSPDGRQIVTASPDRSARIWESRSGQELRTLQGHAGWVRSAAFSPDGTQIVTASADGTARLWETASGQELQCLAQEAPLRSAAFSPDGRQIVTASEDGILRLWEIASGQEVGRLLYCRNGGWIVHKADQPLRWDPQGKGLQALTFIDPHERELPTLWEAEDLQKSGLLPL